jgi:hypothetical protein
MFKIKLFIVKNVFAVCITYCKLAAHLHNMDEQPVIVEHESCEDFIRVLRVHLPDYSFEKLLHCWIFAETVFPDVDDAMQIRHLVDNTYI